MIGNKIKQPKIVCKYNTDASQHQNSHLNYLFIFFKVNINVFRTIKQKKNIKIIDK